MSVWFEACSIALNNGIRFEVDLKRSSIHLKCIAIKASRQLSKVLGFYDFVSFSKRFFTRMCADAILNKDFIVYSPSPMTI